MKKDMVVLGAGMVGISSALALQKRGYQVTLIDKSRPASETSFGNAGMITPSSLVPFNNPTIMRSLPSFLTNKGTGFRYNARYAFSELANLLKFLACATPVATNQRIHALYQLIERSTELHQQWASASERQQLLRPIGWLKLYRQQASFEKSKYERAILEQYDIATTLLDNTKLAAFEPALKPIYMHGLHIEEALSVASPSELAKCYFDQFIALGGEFIEASVNHLGREQLGFKLRLDSKGEQQTLLCEQLVVAAGPWSKALLTMLSIKLPMIFERGAHRQFASSDGPALKHAIHDVDGSFVASPNATGIRVTCGVQLQYHLAKNSEIQLDLVTKNAQQGLAIDQPCISQWHGARPTMPDSMPVIGQSSIKGLWLNTGHQHIGFATGPGSADILADLMQSVTTDNNNPFSTTRFKM